MDIAQSVGVHHCSEWQVLTGAASCSVHNRVCQSQSEAHDAMSPLATHSVDCDCTVCMQHYDKQEVRHLHYRSKFPASMDENTMLLDAA